MSVECKMFISLVATFIMMMVTIAVLHYFGDVAALCLIPIGAYAMLMSARFVVGRFD